jgi:hypothetical protein
MAKAEKVNENTFKKNYASDANVAARFLEYIQPILTATRQNRRTLEAQWIDDIRAWNCLADDMGYQGRANIYVPELHNQIESTVEKMVAGIFAAPDLLHAVPMPGTDRKTADNIRDAVQYELEVKNNLFVKWDDFERQKILLGTSIFKGKFENDERPIYFKDKSGKTKKTMVPKSKGVIWDVKSLFYWYIFPEKATLDKYEVIFEDDLIKLDTLKRQKDKWANLDEVQEVSKDLNHYWVDLENLEMANLGAILEQRRGSVLITEIYCEFELTKGNIVPVQAFLANDNTVIKLVRNPYWFQDHPYVGDGYLKRPGGIFYNFSLPDRIRSQQYQINDLTNHTMDSLTYTLNPITVVDPALAGDVNSMKMMPGAKWLGSPEGIRPMQFPDVSGAGLRAVQEIRGQIAQFSDNSPGLAPQLEGKARSATHASIVQRNVSVRQRVQSGKEEHNVLIPMAYKTFIMLQQFQDETWQIKIQGPDAGSWISKDVKPEDIVGNVEWIWKGASYEDKSAVRSQQLMAFFQQAMQISQMQPGEVDLAGLFRRIAREAFNLTDVDEIFKSLKDKKTVDPEVENLAFKAGEEVVINPGDEDQSHILSHEELLDDPKVKSEVKLKVLNHINTHMAQRDAKEQILQMRARIAAQRQSGGKEGGGGVQAPPSPMEGNRGQISTSEANIMTGVKGTQPNL